MMRHSLLITLVAAATQASAQIAPRDSVAPTALTIDQAIELARRNNPELQQTLNNRIGARAAVRSAYGALLPSADASLSAQRQQGGQQIFSGTSLGASSDVNQSNYQIGINYRINSATLITPSLQRANRDAVGSRCRAGAQGPSAAHRSRTPRRVSVCTSASSPRSATGYFWPRPRRNRNRAGCSSLPARLAGAVSAP